MWNSRPPGCRATSMRLYNVVVHNKPRLSVRAETIPSTPHFLNFNLLHLLYCSIHNLQLCILYKEIRVNQNNWKYTIKQSIGRFNFINISVNQHMYLTTWLCCHPTSPYQYNLAGFWLAPQPCLASNTTGRVKGHNWPS